VSASPSSDVSEMRLERNGTMRVTFLDGRVVTASIGQNALAPTSAIASSTYLPQTSRLQLLTTRGDEIFVELPQSNALAPLEARPTIYLDQNHWSTLTNVLHEPDRVTNSDERDAAVQLIELATARKVVLPMSSAHMLETCKQVDREERYRRALTIVQLSAGWQLRDPLDLRRFEIRQALTVRYRQFCLLPPAAVTLEPNAVHASRRSNLPDIDSRLPVEARWTVHAIRSIGGIVDTMLDADNIPMAIPRGWVSEFQSFATFLRRNPSSKELKRRRTFAKFIADLRLELCEEAARAGITPEQVSDWTLNQSEADLRSMPSLGLFREVLHEKLSDGSVRWEANDLIDMIYLASAAGYCQHVVGERRHTSYIGNGLRRLGRTSHVHPNLRSLIKQLEPIHRSAAARASVHCPTRSPSTSPGTSQATGNFAGARCGV